jgi:hypothetical protein
MRGVITGKDVVLNSLTIVRLFGMTTYLTCLWATITRKPSTFLGSLYAASARTSPRWRPSR